MIKPLVSILIPAYNAEKYIAETISSALAQSWPRKEIIVVDDESTDETVSVARRFCSKNVSVVTKQNEGAAAARNHAFSLSQGDYIQWLDADDLLSVNKVADQMSLAERDPSHRILFLSGWGHFNYRTARAKFSPTALWCDQSPVEFLLNKMGQHLHMQPATWLTSRELIQAAGPWDTRLLSDDDGEYFCRVILACKGIVFAQEAKVFYRMTPSSRLSYVGRSDRKMDGLLLSMLLHVKYIRSVEESERVRAACIAYLQSWLINFYPERPDIVKQLEALAVELGGQLKEPPLRRKYAWIKPLFGWRLAKQAQLVLPLFKASVMRSFDKAMYNWEQSARAS
jgi:glycosyltransferase involved in cell wall biosynthesis